MVFKQIWPDLGDLFIVCDAIERQCFWYVLLVYEGGIKFGKKEIKDPKKDYGKNPFLTVSSAFNGFLLRPARIQLNTRQR